MSIRVVTSYSTGQHLIDPKVEQVGMLLTLAFNAETRFRGSLYGALGVFEFPATSHPDDEIGVCGYLVLDSDGNLDLLVDQVGGYFPSSRYEFESGGPYERVALLFSFRVPPGARTLDDADVVFYRTLVREKGERAQPSRLFDAFRAQPVRERGEEDGTNA